MNSPIRTKILPLAIASLLAASAPAMAQVTSSAISGRVLDNAGQPVAGATVQIVHEPSGTTKITTTGADGRYSAQGMRVGGPFDVTASKAGLTQGEQDQVYLQLGQESTVNLTMSAEQAKNVQDLSGVTVSAREWPRIGHSPQVGLCPKMPQKWAGTRIDPPMSVPISSPLNPAATAAAPPPELPPGVRARFHGFEVVP